MMLSFVLDFDKNCVVHSSCIGICVNCTDTH
jgi:hypothetical protein